MPDRRDVLAALAAAPVLGAWPAAAGAATLDAATLDAAPAMGEGSYPYDYLFIEVPERQVRGSGVEPFLAYLRGPGRQPVEAAGGEIIGAFLPLIGWTSEQLVVLIRWPGASPARERAVATISRQPSVAKMQRTQLAPTLRPSPTTHPKPTGIYTHRWFTIHMRELSEFLRLSATAWPDFERDFASQIFGLFRAQPTAAEARSGRLRMLLNTQYDTHAVWEASRTPSPTAADSFRRRAELTLTSQVVSCRFVPIG